jgi:hypothetical protein
MSISEKDYRKLYRIQDKILLALKPVISSFYLTGGTALGRFYINHRFSEDLYFFLNKSDTFRSSVKNIERVLVNKFSLLKQESIVYDDFDIYSLAQHYMFNWLEVFGEAKNKAIINEIDVEQRIKSFPVVLFQKVDWHILLVDIAPVSKAIQTLANDFLLGSDNSLGINKPSIEDAMVINPQSNL